jgi:alpha-glucuronidase
LAFCEETGYDAWLRYPEIDYLSVKRSYDSIPVVVAVLEDSPILKSAQAELIRGLRGMLDRTLRIASGLPDEGAILLGTFDAIKRALPNFNPPTDLVKDGFLFTTMPGEGHSHIVVTAPDDRGVLYGAFAFLRNIALHEPLDKIDRKENPNAPIRMINQWDNPDGTIERGYAGLSIFWENGHVVEDLTRVNDYARLMASVGINCCTINNVNADSRVLANDWLVEVARVADVFRKWGVQLFASINLASPTIIGGLETFDPLDPSVQKYWSDKAEEIYGIIPDFGGFVLKADSEGRLGPSAYGRTHADAANTLARPLQPYGGTVFYRGFVYDHHMDWRNLKNDRARASYENFHDLDGQFEDNVVIQIKHGPIDFQVREPASPIFGGLEKTNQVIEVQVTQEYLGQQRHLCFLPPMWKEALDFDMHSKGAGTPVKVLTAGKIFQRPLGGMVSVTNVGLDANWLGHHLAMANLYGFGRLAWNPDLSSAEIAGEWTRLTFGHDSQVVETITEMLLSSWKTYEDYTGPLGIGTLTDIIHIHFGPGVESSERNGWGQWHRSDEHGTGLDRTVATGTEYTGQYRTPVAKMYESLETCPDELLLFFHHVPYTHALHSGKTVIQYLYDAHYEGAEKAQDYVLDWKTLKGKIDESRYCETLARLEYQAGHAIVWRDAVCRWFCKMSGIHDAKKRVGNYPDRIEAEKMELDGYEVIDVVPWETASGGKAAQCVGPNRQGAVSTVYNGPAGWYNVAIQYFDQCDGVSRYRLRIAEQEVDSWRADQMLPSSRPDGHTSTRRTVMGVALRPGDEIRVEAQADGVENAAIDYIEITPTR